MCRRSRNLCGMVEVKGALLAKDHEAQTISIPTQSAHSPRLSASAQTETLLKSLSE